MEARPITEESPAEVVLASIVGESVATRRLRERIRALAPLRVAVLVAGEEGSGRDHVVRALHAVDSGVDGELIRITGRSEAARRLPPPGAACYLDEVGRFTLSEQAHWFERLVRSDVHSEEGLRIFASTSQDLATLARRGEFHPALARSLLRFEIRTTPLRDRPEDIPPLVAHLVDRIAGEVGRSRVRIAESALNALTRAPWPGNVRELAEALEKLVAFSANGEITVARVRDVFGELPDCVASLRQQRRDEQRDELVTVLEACRGNLAEAARRLGISRGAVIYRAQKFGLLPRRV